MSLRRQVTKIELIDCIQQLDVYRINEIIDCLQQLGQQERESPEEKEIANKMADLILGKE